MCDEISLMGLFLLWDFLLVGIRWTIIRACYFITTTMCDEEILEGFILLDQMKGSVLKWNWSTIKRTVKWKPILFICQVGRVWGRLSREEEVVNQKAECRNEMPCMWDWKTNKEILPGIKNYLEWTVCKLVIFGMEAKGTPSENLAVSVTCHHWSF